MVQVIIGFAVIAIATLIAVAVFFDNSTPSYKYLTPEEMDDIKKN